MHNIKTVTVLVVCIILLSALSTAMGIFSYQGSGPYQFRSIRGQNVEIYGKGMYRHMSAEVAIQGIAQDYVTLCLAIPLLILSLYFTRRGSIRARYTWSFSAC